MEQYGVIRGRHRVAGARIAGVAELRCDVHGHNGDVSLRSIPVEQLVPDPDVQFEWAFSTKRAEWMGQHWDSHAVGVLDVSTLGNGGLSVREKHELKVKKDRHRRSVRAIEHFLNRVGAGEPVAVRI